MTHDELLDKIDMRMLTAAHTDAWNIVLAVAQLHTVAKFNGGQNHGLNKRCAECGFKTPCPTIQAIEEELS